MRRVLHGVLLLDKPEGWSSNDALQKARGLLRAAKAGHTGTLDPLATGLLPLCFGAATKFAQASLDADKRYEATLRLGERTTTGDREGEVIARCSPDGIAQEVIDRVLRQFTGPLSQRPPMHSALKVNGRALYDYAREGIEVERAPRDVVVHALERIGWSPPLLRLDVRCSKGTYVRTLAEEIGAALGCGAHLGALRRTGSGSLSLDGALTLAEFEALPEAQREARLLPPDVLLGTWSSVSLGAEDAARFLCGVRRRTNLDDAGAVRVYGAGAFLGTAHVRAGELIPDRLLSPSEVEALAA